MSIAATQAQVRMAAVADTPLIAGLVEHYWRFENIGNFDAAEIRKLLNTLVSQPQLGAAWLATIGGDPVGYAVVSFMFSLERRGMMAEIDEFFVLPHARSQGVGEQLLTATEKHLRAREFVCLQLQVGADNHAARAFYQRRGFADRAAYRLLDKGLTAERS